MKKAQTFSTDAIVAVAMFIIAVIMLFYLSGPAAENRQSERLQSEAKKLPAVLGSEQNISAVFIKGSKIDDEKLREAANLRYDNLKDLLGMKSDFCIYLEDENGNIVPVTGDKVGIGSPLVKIGGKSCSGLGQVQVIICEEADKAGECDRVEELGVTQQECCTYVGVCCP